MLPPQYIGPDANIKNALVDEGCTVLGEIKLCAFSRRIYRKKYCYKRFGHND